MEHVIIREATESDVDGIMKLEESAYSDDAFDKDGLSIALCDKAFLVLVAVENNDVIAFNISEITNGGIHLIDIVVRSDFRCNGIAAELTRASVIYTPHVIDAHRIWAEVRESNLPSRHSLENEGFVIEGRIEHYYNSPSEDAVIYALKS